ATLIFIDMVRKLDVVRTGRMRVAMIANRLRERTNSAKQLDATLERLTEAALIRVRDSQVYVTLANLGQSVFDNDSAAVRTHQDDWKTLLEWLERRAADSRTGGKVTELPTSSQRLGS
ncbi:MAG: hypothetical protein IT476_11900, partial [Rhodanobacteraceae bacterium]|nr:hypothetical protein [Rhodanobacteraceae bacterium]